jgi:hypothetical protein
MIGLPVEAPESNRIDDYLLRIESRLDIYAPDVREGILRELRQHIEALVATNEANGCERDVAITAALDQFGSIEQLAHRFRRAHTQMAWRAHPFLFLGAPLLWCGSLLTAGLVTGREINTAATEIPGLLLTLSFPLLYCLIYSYFPSPIYQAPKRRQKPILVDLIIPVLWYGGNFLAGWMQGGIGGAVGMVRETPMPAALWCFSLGWLVAPYVLSALVSGRQKRLTAR